MKTRAAKLGAVTSLAPWIVLILVVAAAVNLFGPVRNWRRLSREIVADRQRLDDVQVLYPLYAELAALDQPAQWPGLQPPEPRRLPETEVTAIPERFLQMAAACRLELDAVSPRVVNAAAARHLDVELKGSGPYAQLQPFLMALARMPELERIRKLDVRREALQERFAVMAQLVLE